MTEGNIASWKVKEGDSFNPGDVLLEIETDKATMDVEAQEEGVVFKIISADGAKGVQVGQRIAVFAETSDDLSSLEVPADDTSAVKSEPKPKKEEPPSSQEETSSRSEMKAEESSQSPAGPGTKTSDLPEGSPTKTESTAQQGGTTHKQTYPLYPAVQSLLHANGYSNEEADKIQATGPNGRVLKGDVLAYLGRISKSYPSEVAKRVEILSHLDLSNIQVKPKDTIRQPQDANLSSRSAPPELPKETEIALPISLSAVIATQKRVQDSLGIFLPLSTFIARASELANEALPASKAKAPTADDLFNSVLGLDQVPRSSRGHFIPQITGISTPPVVPVRTRRPDIIDMLAPRAAKTRAPVVPRAALGEVGVSAGANVFSVTAKAGDEGRATEYLERMKLALEKEPGRLVL